MAVVLESASREESIFVAWAYGLAVFAELVWVALAVAFWATEKPRLVREQRGNSGSELHKLY